MSPSVSSERRPDLDWIRVGAFFLLILYHVGMFYVPWDFHVKSPHPVEWLQPLMWLTNPWRLTLLFLVSGAATRFMADKLSAGGLARARTARLLPPILLAVFVIVPPQTYYEIVEKLAYAGSFAEFYGKYVTASGHWRPGGEPLITPTYNHMWFVVYLFLYSLILAAALKWGRGLVATLDRGVERALDGWGLLVWPVLALVVLRATLFPMFEVTHALIDDWYNHAVSFGVFLLGFLIAKSEVLKSRFIALRWPALLLAIASYGAYAALSWFLPDTNEVSPGEIARQTAFALDQWFAIAAVLGFGGKHLTRGGPVLTYLTLGVFPFYIVHQTFIVVAGHYLAQLGMNQALEAAILIAGTFAACFATYEIVRRVNVLRPLFGLKPLAAAEHVDRADPAPVNRGAV
ncbi:acyltransferase family protein [Phenylobacterium sp. LH3H17]|uniref:acyltransferase family protein n=1 Tax=Phenylobacterium sp. LH3H17 TaxID=2903901 RepID=UPI0020C95BC7|nr:acyltransferase family protein [Phenylobacterium sp. LH3H17]UTP39191.1 acyltransferase family protein [Phenylobacterium sp. LH3H17]